MANLFKTLLGCTFLTCTALSASNITAITFSDAGLGWNSDSLARMYFHHSETQRQWAWESLSKVTLSGNEKILDFGCGDGKISAEMARLVRNGSVLGVDLSKKMIHLARIYFPNYAFHNLTFQNNESVTFSDMPGKQDYDLVCAFTVFHLISNPLEVLKNLKAHLKPTGKLLLTIPTGKNQILYQAANEIFPKYGLKTPWGNNNFEEMRSMRTLEGCSSFLYEAGYQIESIEIIDSDNPFYDIEDFIAWMMGTITATWQIPASLSQDFFTDLAHRMYELNPSMIDEEGRFRFNMPRLHATAVPNPQNN